MKQLMRLWHGWRPMPIPVLPPHTTVVVEVRGGVYYWQAKNFWHALRIWRAEREEGLY